MLKSLGLEIFDVSPDRLDFFKGEYAGLVKTHKKIGILFDPDIFGFVFHDQEFHVLLPLNKLNGESVGKSILFKVP